MLSPHQNVVDQQSPRRARWARPIVVKRLHTRGSTLMPHVDFARRRSWSSLSNSALAAGMDDEPLQIYAGIQER